MDIVNAARRMLAAQPDVPGVLGSDLVHDMWLFQELLYAEVEQSQHVAVVLAQRGSWTSANEHNTMKFPRLMTEFWSDPNRDLLGNVTDQLSAKDRIIAAHEVVDKYLHRPDAAGMWWPDMSGVRVLRSTRQGELDFFPTVPDGDGIWRGVVYYAIGVG